ncbi:unnamed protein product [Adineta steineri]|uniref:Leucine--tRNA ligase n=1 Tax=Adineta steineri TaxID=433720 RepID=A0A818WK62_9BILA|nr:unnamed protein product [Adineta steineri]
MIKSRSGDECVVALCDQWFIDYGNKEWKDDARRVLQQLNVFSDDTRQNFEGVFDWLHEHACSRSYGLGTKLPWDKQYLIESLSDSTIYMAYYTVAHLLQQQDSFDGKKIGNSLKTSISKKTLDRLRNEFQYWYPGDLRSSGKDLIPNHLTYSLYNHVAIWPNQEENRCPKAFRANGHLFLNGEKMSKSTGNFMTLIEAVERFSADGMRLNLADAGDSIENANSDGKNAEAQLLRLYTFIQWAKEIVAMSSSHTTNQSDIQESTDGNKSKDYFDRVFQSEINRSIKLTQEAYDNMLYKEVLKHGFFQLQKNRDNYRELCSETEQLNIPLLKHFIEIQALILSPICPHICDYVYQLLYPNKSIMEAKWPVAGEIDQSLIDSYHNKATIYVAANYPQWQTFIINELKNIYQEKSSFPEAKTLASHFTNLKGIDAKYIKKTMPFVSYCQTLVNEANNNIHILDRHLTFNEYEILNDNQQYIKRELRLDELHIIKTDDAVNINNSEDITPGKPLIQFYV